MEQYQSAYKESVEATGRILGISCRKFSMEKEMGQSAGMEF